MSQKLWVQHITTGQTFGPTRVSIDGCEYVDDLLEEIRKKFALSVPPSHLTLYQPDGTTEIKVGDCPADYLEGNTDGNPLIVRIVEITENPSISIVPKTSPSKVALVLRSNMTTEEKESILKDILEVQAKERELQAKDREVQAKEREVQDKVSLYEALKEKTQRIEAERDFLKGTLDARHIIETYELRFPTPNPKAPKPTRAERWKKHLDLNTTILDKLQECDKKIRWQHKAAEIYDDLCRSIHQRTIDIGNGKYIVMIEKSLPKTSSCFVRVLAKELYGDNVVVQEETLGGVTSEMEAS